MRYPLMRDYPSSFVVRDTKQKWFVKFVSSNQMWDLDPSHNDGSLTLGLTWDTERTIYILRGQTPAKRWATFCQELLHVIELEMKVPIRHATIYKLDTPLAELLADLGFAFA